MEGPREVFLDSLNIFPNPMIIVKQLTQKINLNLLMTFTALEIVNLLSIGMSNFNAKISVPNDIPSHNGYISKENLKTQSYLDEIFDWIKQMKMKLNTDKSQIMIFNFTHNHQFETRVNIDDVKHEVIDNIKPFGTHITSDLKWDLIKKANARMKLLRKISTFGASTNDLVHISVIFVRSVLKASSSVWRKSLTKENESDLERVQKSAFRLILSNAYISYENSQIVLQMQTLLKRRETLFTNITLKSISVKE